MSAGRDGLELRVLHVVFSLDPGGMENGVVNLANGLEADGVRAWFACIDRAGAFAERLKTPGRTRVLGRSSGFSPVAAWRLARMIRSVRPHVLHTHNLGPLIYGALASAGGILCPLLHGEHAELAGGDLSPRRLRQRRALYARCRAVHTVSEGMTRQLAGLGLCRGTIRTLVNGVDAERFSPGEKSAAKQAAGLPGEAEVVGMVGRFGRQKRHAFAVEMFGHLAARRPGARLLVVGASGPEERAVRERVAASPFASRILLAGFRQDPVPWYRAMDLLLIPSENEGMSNAMLEAMACGVPVFSNRNCGAEEVIGEGGEGFVAAMEHPGETAAALAGLFAGGGLGEAGRRAREKVLNRYSLGAMLRAYAALYREIASGVAR